ncbi:lanthionine synthetase C family protein [Streptomyces sp. NBC_00287]|uniref:lanthionine synthetase C family protein n=1 Tax=Streptomyces sp. NBC_00287 TaxID=2975702 RepID=UPI002E29F913|nr:lanthionine synthetase C family protein [Streptomyces sp. NBC_00287]
MTIAPPAIEAGLATRQSLAHGPLGIALLHIERARRGLAPWQSVHRQLAAVRPLIDGDDASLFLGAPAMTYVLHLAAADSDRYAGALRTLDDVVATHIRRRLAAAHARIDQGRYASFAEYDLFRGLTGLGALLLRRRPESDELKAVLEYLVRLTEPAAGPKGQPLPGWWVGHAPAGQRAATPGGHANAGLAHGITGPLALLALAKRHGITVNGHDAAMARICRWLDRIRRSDHHGTRWPRWIATTGPTSAAPTAPSWCYGVPGVARAQQLAAIALGDEDRKRMAERALLYCLSDPHQLDQLTTRGLCHGIGGLLRTVQRVAEDAEIPTVFTDRLPELRERFLALAPPEDDGFLEGAAGAALAFQSPEPGSAPANDWDACLLLC